MNKKLLLIASSCTLLFGLTSCGKDNPDPVNPEYIPLFELKKNSATIDMFDTYLLETKEEFEGTIFYTSSDDSIASVDIDGLVYTHDKEGQVTITATCGNTTQECRITVLASSNINFEFEYQNVSVEVGDTLRIPYAVTYDGKDVTDQVDVKFSQEDDTYIDLVDVYGKNSLGVFAKKVGSSTVNVYSVINNVYYTEVVNVDVVSPDYVVYCPSLKGDVNSYSCDLFIYSASEDHLTSIDLNGMKVYFAGREVSDAIIEKTILDETIAKIDDSNHLVPLKVGETTMKLNYQGNVFNTKINVKKEIFNLEKSVTIDKHITNQINFDADNILGTPEDLIIDNASTSIFGSYSSATKTVTIDSDQIPNNTKYLEYQPLTLETDLVSYKFNSVIYTVIARTVADLKACENVCKVPGTNSFGGYIILANDIAWNSVDSIFNNNTQYTGAETAQDGFCGIFDGNGYTISGFNSNHVYRGLFGNCLGEPGIIKNLALTDVHIGGGKMSAITTVAFGTFENLYIQVSSVDSNASGGGLVSCWKGGALPTAKGVYLDYGENPISTKEDNTGFIPVSYQDVGTHAYCVVSGTYRSSSKIGTIYESYAALNADLENSRAFLPYPYWNNETTLSFGHFHTVVF